MKKFITLASLSILVLSGCAAPTVAPAPGQKHKGATKVQTQAPTPSEAQRVALGLLRVGINAGIGAGLGKAGEACGLTPAQTGGLLGGVIGIAREINAPRSLVRKLRANKAPHRARNLKNYEVTFTKTVACPCPPSTTFGTNPRTTTFNKSFNADYKPVGFKEPVGFKGSVSLRSDEYGCKKTTTSSSIRSSSSSSSSYSTSTSSSAPSSQSSSSAVSSGSKTSGSSSSASY